MVINQDDLKEEIDIHHLSGYIHDLISNFLYYDRKDDEELHVGDIEQAIQKGTVTIDEIVLEFKKQLEKALVQNKK